MVVCVWQRTKGRREETTHSSPSRTLPPLLPAPSQEADAAPGVVVADRSSVDDYVASRSVGQAACPSPAKHTPHTAAAAIPLNSTWLRSCLDAFGVVRARVLAARDAATPDPLSPSFETVPRPPPPPPLPSSPDAATWPAGPGSARALAATPQPTIVAALVAVADACGGGDGQPPLPAVAARWAHALAANLEKPLPPAASAALARLAAAAGADAAAAGDDADRSARAAVVAAVAGGWFGQCASLAAAARVD